MDKTFTTLRCETFGINLKRIYDKQTQTKKMRKFREKSQPNKKEKLNIKKEIKKFKIIQPPKIHHQNDKTKKTNIYKCLSIFCVLIML